MAEKNSCPICGAGLTMFGGSYDGKAEQIWFCEECDKIGNGWLWAESQLTLAAATRAREIAAAVRGKDEVIDALWRQMSEDDYTLCRLCKIVNPQHKDCDSCGQRDARLAAIAKARAETGGNDD